MTLLDDFYLVGVVFLPLQTLFFVFIFIFFVMFLGVFPFAAFTPTTHSTRARF